MKSSLKEKIVFITALLLMNYRVNLIGSMSLTEIYVITQIPYLLKWLYGFGKQIPNLHKIAKGFYLLIGIQCLAEFVVGNSFTNAIKGIAVTIMTLFLMLFFLEKLVKDVSLIFYIPIAHIVGLILFGDQFRFAETGEMIYFKFYVAPIVASSVVAVSLIKKKWVQRNIYMLLMSASLFIIIGGARSLGFSMFFTVFGLFLYNRYRTIRFKKLLSGLIIIVIIVQLFLTFVYMPKVRSGEWGSEQNRSQFEKINWNSNIFMILFAARTDFFVSTIAFLERPLWGFGSWAIDYTGKYFILQAEMVGDDDQKIDLEALRYVPCHSVVIGKGVSNGIFAFLVFLWIFINIYAIGLKGLRRSSIYNTFLLWTIISSFQHLMFGPPAILKNNGAMAFAIMLTLYYINYKTNETKSDVICSYSNV